MWKIRGSVEEEEREGERHPLPAALGQGVGQQVLAEEKPRTGTENNGEGN